jgi:pyridoxal phosphate enzyme (YggS family)
MNKPYKENYQKILEDLNIEATKWNRLKPQLVAVTKKRSKHDILTFINVTNHKVYAENYVQEAEQKYVEIKNLYDDVKLHLIGHLQSNKVKNAVRLFDVIETIDSFKLAKAIDKTERDLEINREYLIQVNIGQEPQKSGVLPKDLVQLVADIKSNLSINLKGLMCVPPKDKNPSIYFAMLKNLADSTDLKYLSIGMSSDFKEAIAIGSNQIRIGTSLFSNI